MDLLLRIYHWLDVRLYWRRYIQPVIEHPVPKTNWWYVLGSATLVAFIVQVVTGVMLAFVYVPAPNSAYDTLQFITNQATLGSVLRGIHYWGASAMVVLIFAHTIRVFLMGSYKFPREMNWLTGAGLLLLTLGMAFTGQLLRWNQDAYWAVVVAAEQAGRTPIIGDWLVHLVVAGNTVGGQTLTRFYATHVFLLPALMFMLIGAHIYLLVVHGITDVPQPGVKVEKETEQARYHAVIEKEGIPFWPDAAWKDVVFALAVGSIVVLLAIFVGPADLGKIADPTNLQAYPRPDWYFLWYFALLSLIPKQIENYVIIGVPALAGLGLVLLPFIAPYGERSARMRPWAVGTVVVSLLAIGVLLVKGFAAPWSPALPVQPVPTEITQSLSGQELRGSQLFEQEACIACHKMGDVGGSRGPDLTHVGNRLTQDQITWRILYGGGVMPAYGQTLSPEDLNALVAFLQSRK